MKFLVLLASALTATNANVIIDPNASFNEGDRYIFMSDEVGFSHLVDLKEPVNAEFVKRLQKGAELYEYYLYTRNNPTTPQYLTFNDESSVANSNFDVSKPVIVTVHGWRSSGTINIELRNALLANADVNVIVLGWTSVSDESYTTAKAGTAAVGRALGDFLVFLTTIGASYNNMHLIGHSLGAHLVGNAGRLVGGHIRRITGLDPAGILWNLDPNRIAATDGDYVEIIHTDTALMGIDSLCGDADFYPNGGSNMPGCLLSTCSHSRAWEYMVATIKYNHMYANECVSVSDAKNNTCTGDLLAMGNDDLTKNAAGIYRINTLSSYPY